MPPSQPTLPNWARGPIAPIFQLGRAVIANFRHGRPAKGLKIIGVTGTRGKTTTIHFLASILRAAGYKVGFATSDQRQLTDTAEDNRQLSVQADPQRLQAWLKQAKSVEVDWVILEVGTDDLTQQRLWGVTFHTVVLTNLCQDYSDRQQTMDQSAATKSKLFSMVDQNAVLNHDDEWFDYFTQVAPQARFSYGVHSDADVRLLRANLKPTASKIIYQYGHHNGPQLVAELKLPGKFNVYNALAAAAVGYALELAPDVVKKGLENLKGVPGRLTTVTAGQNFAVVVDQAQSPDNLRNLFENLKPLTRGRLIAVLGASIEGDRPQQRLVGSLVAKMVELVIVTNSVPAAQNADAVRQALNEVISAVESRIKVEEVADRHDAIARAFQLAERGDIVAILGNIPTAEWDDAAIARKLLEETAKV